MYDSVRLPPVLFRIAPPLVLTSPLMSDIPMSVRFVVLPWISKWREFRLASSVIRRGPAPVIVSVSVTVSWPLVSVMRPGAAKVIVSGTPGVAFAKPTASRRDPAPLSASVETT